MVTGDGWQARGEDKLGWKPAAESIRVEENGAIGHMPVAVRERPVGIRKFSERQIGERGTGDADGFGCEIAEGLDASSFVLQSAVS